MLELENVDVFYGNIQALKNVSLRVEQGELVTIVGSNGAGKSTILMTVSGVLQPKQGRILLEGKPIAGVSPHKLVASGIAHCPEGRLIFGKLRITRPAARKRLRCPCKLMLAAKLVFGEAAGGRLR